MFMFGAGLPTPPKRPTGGLQSRVNAGDPRSNTVRGRETRAQQSGDPRTAGISARQPRPPNLENPFLHASFFAVLADYINGLPCSIALICYLWDGSE